MCGIAGYVAYAPAVVPDDARVILSMTRRMAHRGPDDEGLALFGPADLALALRTAETAAGAAAEAVPVERAGRVEHTAALGHRRFSIVDLAPRGHQPFWSADGGSCVTFNGEIYNFVELRAELERAGRRFHTTSDTEVLLEAYLEWGEGCFERFVGFWALALYDRRRRGVLLARDRMGKAPLYVGRHAGILYWASEIAALREGAGRQTFPVREQAVADYVTLGLRDVGDRTFFAGIDTFPRASWAWVGDDGSLVAKRYWELPERRLTERQMPPARAAAELRERLSEAVRVRLRADVPVGLELSGGMDSSALVALAAEQGRPLRAFTVTFPGTEADELAYARAVHERWSDVVELEVLEPALADFFDVADDFVALMGEPFHSPVLLTNQNTWRAMREHGIKVSINGGAGDEMFAGYVFTYFRPYLAWLLRHGRLLRLHREATRLSEIPVGPVSRAALMRLRTVLGQLRREGDTEPDDAWRRAHALAGTALRAPAPVVRPTSGLETLMREQATDWLMNMWLRTGHQACMGVPIEVRGPFLDQRVVDLAFTLPPTVLMRDGWFKWVLREATRDLLPDEVVWRRRKMGFPFPLAAWLEANRQRFFTIVDHATEPCPYVALDELRSGWGRLAEEDPALLWRLVCLCLWWQRCVLGEPLDA